MSNPHTYYHINQLIQELPEWQKENVSDGYHTFKELYAHRVKLFIALCNTLIWAEKTAEWCPWSMFIRDEKTVWKSKRHADGSMCGDDWFIAGIWNKVWKTLTYHLPMSEWNNLQSFELDNAPSWDWHTSDDVLKLLSNF